MINIFDAVAEQYPVINSLAHRIWPHAFGKILSKDQIAYMLDWMYSIEAITEQIEKRGHHFILAKINDEYIGYTSYENNYNNSNDTKLHKIYVLPEFQRMGTGSILTKEVAKRAAEAGNKNLLLNVNRNN